MYSGEATEDAARLAVSKRCRESGGAVRSSVLGTHESNFHPLLRFLSCAQRPSENLSCSPYERNLLCFSGTDKSLRQVRRALIMLNDLRFKTGSVGLLAILFGLLGVVGQSWAEGNCPSGYYPIGGQGVQGCAPMGGGSGSHTYAGPTWRSKWGAIAFSRNGVAGISNDLLSKRAAKRAARKHCAERGGEGCKIKFWYANQCVAAGGKPPNSPTFFGTGDSREEASTDALNRCSRVVGEGCSIVYKACSFRERNWF